MFIRELLERLAKAEIRFCVVGGVAVNLHGVPRMTYDVDIVVVPEREQLRAAAEVLTELGLRCRVPVALESFADPAYRPEASAERNLVAVTFTDPNDPLREVDVLVSPPVDASELVARAVHLRLACPWSRSRISSRLKKASGRAQDLADIAHLERVSNERP